MSQIIAEAWGIYERKLLDPVRAGPIQRKETRRDYYAGAYDLLASLVKSFGPESHDPTEADLAVMDSVNEELQAFLRDVAEGRA